jgi:hypothetical protein
VGTSSLGRAERKRGRFSRLASLGDYYAFLGDYAQQVVASAAKDTDTVRQYLAGFEAAGTDDVICFPTSADVSQVDRLAEAAL